MRFVATETLPRHYITGIIIFTFFIVGGVSMISILGDSDATLTQDTKFQRFNQSFNVMGDVSSSVGDLESGITEADTDFGTFGVLNALISSAWQSVRLLFSSFGFMTGVWSGMSELFGVPAWVAGLIALLVTVMIAFAIYTLIFQREA